jgi:outer membrane immunogenic protein
MKKLILLGLILGGLTLNTNAQTIDAKVGIKAGANLMMGGKLNLGGTEFTSKYVPGFQAGLFLDLPLSESLTFSPEVLYSQKGSKFEGSGGATFGEVKSKLGYVDIPVLLKINATPAFNFVVGPQASLLVNHETTTTVNGTVVSTVTDKDDLRKSIAGGIVGVGYKMTPNLNLNARYSMDFQSVAKDNINQDKAKLSGFALSLGYSF